MSDLEEVSSIRPKSCFIFSDNSSACTTSKTWYVCSPCITLSNKFTLKLSMTVVRNFNCIPQSFRWKIKMLWLKNRCFKHKTKYLHKLRCSTEGSMLINIKKAIEYFTRNNKMFRLQSLLLQKQMIHSSSHFFTSSYNWKPYKSFLHEQHRTIKAKVSKRTH